MVFGPPSPHRTISTSNFLVLTLSTLWLGRYGPVIIGVVWCWWRLYKDIKGQGQLIFGLVAECIWWWMGNRFEYSGVDALGSFVFSAEYSPWLNSIGLAVYLVCPQLIFLELLSFQIKEQGHSKEPIKI